MIDYVKNGHRKRRLFFGCIALLLVFLLIVSCAGCGIYKVYATGDLTQYGEFGDYSATQKETVSEYVDGFLPDRIEDYFERPRYFFQACNEPVMHEVFLEFVIEDEERYDAYVRSVIGDAELTPFAHAKEFDEYVLKDKLNIVDADEHSASISDTEIKKILFSDDTNTVIYVSLTIPWPDMVFFTKDFAYFRRFGIDAREY